MKNFQITISKKILFIFLINSFVTIIITGLVIQSFTDISGSVQFTSKSFSFFKSNLDYIRLEQEKLKNTISLIDASIENALKTKNKLIQSSNNVKDLTERLLEDKFSLIHSLSIDEELKVKDQINKIGELNLSLSKILGNVAVSLNNTFEARKIINEKIPGLKETFKEFEKNIDKIYGRLLMKSSKTVTALSTGSSTESLSEGIKAKEKTKKDFYRIFSEFKNMYNVLTDTRKTGMSGDLRGNFDKSIKEFGVYLGIIQNDFYQKKYDAFATSLEQNLESALNEHSNVTSTNQSVIFFNNTNDSLGEVIEKIRNKINTEYESSTDKVINDAQQFVWVVIVISIIGLAVSLLFGLFVRRSITAPVNDLVDMSKDIAQGEGDLTK